MFASLSSNKATSVPPDVAPDFSGLVSHDQSKLLDLVNSLRNLGIDKWIDLPQLIVVGDQNSGKSSVLEAIAGVPFPRNDGLCTTFVTELRLHRSDMKPPIVKLIASPHHDSLLRQAIEAFTYDKASIANFGDAVEKAKAHLRTILGTPSDSFHEDKLVFEVFDPTNPSLTLVDLPGLIHIPNPDQSQQDVQVVEEIIRAHMQKKKSIILAVVSAKNEIANQMIVGWAREYDPKGERTLGVITKPDCLSRGSPLENTFLNTAQNNFEQFYMGLGWHVVKNLSFEEGNQAIDRDTCEREWFAQHEYWANTVGAGSVGIVTLRDTLSGLLEDHTRRCLPEVILGIRHHLASCRSDLQKLGAARHTANQQRQFLTQISEQFTHLIHLADQGMYGQDPFFTENASDMLTRNLRARIQKQNRMFSDVMSNWGHDIQHIELADGTTTDQVDNFKLGRTRTAGTPAIAKRKDILAKVQEVKDAFGATELDGTAGNPSIIQELFRIKSRKWHRIAQLHIDSVWEVVKNLLHAIAKHVTNDTTAQRLIRDVIHEPLEDKKNSMARKLEEILAPHHRRHPITYNPAFTFKINSPAILEDGHDEDEDDKEYDEDVPNSDTDALEFASELNILRYVEAFYEVALRTFVDNVAVLVVEMCLLDSLASVFTPTSVSEMSPERLASLAAEPSSKIQERENLEYKLRRLEHAERQCSRHADYNSIDAFSQTNGVKKDISHVTTPDSIDSYSSGLKFHSVDDTARKAAKTGDS